MLQARFAARGGAFSVMQQGGGMDDLQVGAFCPGKSLRHAVDTLNV
ncbi:hypothetical protein SDC9_150123 [bioreactor metagenome]|uniref:Uncharacterized protein n=1 Tax=bioreactor metagenome TaxID=1076179 RepID=A0A645ENQ9_9ZZZZ